MGRGTCRAAADQPTQPFAQPYGQWRRDRPGRARSSSAARWHTCNGRRSSAGRPRGVASSRAGLRFQRAPAEIQHSGEPATSPWVTGHLTLGPPQWYFENRPALCPNQAARARQGWRAARGGLPISASARRHATPFRPTRIGTPVSSFCEPIAAPEPLARPTRPESRSAAAGGPLARLDFGLVLFVHGGGLAYATSARLLLDAHLDAV